MVVAKPSQREAESPSTEKKKNKKTLVFAR
jgi:hypothetical protein